ncbi:MAG TPA: choice-of-anchor A family protein [Acetobacteraceae bacterium]|nr:choice-of-anchor A family protein [Acetobacteraceae bacterium]
MSLKSLILGASMIAAATLIGGIADPGAAHADQLSAATILQDFNAVIYDNASTSADIEGAAVVGGNFSGATMYSNPTGSQPSGFGALTVFGSTSGNPININNGGSAYVAGTEGAIIDFNGGGTYIAAPGATIADFETPLDDLSTELSQLTATGTVPSPANNEVITAVPGSDGIAVINLTATQLEEIPSYKIDLNGASTLIINVSGSSIDFNANDESGITGADNIIWNFYDATSVTLGTQIAGTVLAPDANVTNDNQIDGTLVAKSWTGQGELHEYPFDGTLPATSVPEPGSLGLLAAGLAAFFLLRSVRRRNASG